MGKRKLKAADLAKMGFPLTQGVFIKEGLWWAKVFLGLSIIYSYLCFCSSIAITNL